MSSISLPLKMLIAGSALAGFTLLACGGDDSGSKDTDTNNGKATTADAGKSTKDSGTAAKDAGFTITHAEPGDDCDPSASLPYALCSGCGATYCTVTCGSDGTYGDCVNPVAGFGDSGLLGGLKTDAGTYSVKDGSVSIMVGDASLTIPGTACPDSLTCSTMSTSPLAGFINSATGGLPFCSAASGLPPTCTTPGSTECADMGLKVAMCTAIPILGNACIQICK